MGIVCSKSKQEVARQPRQRPPTVPLNFQEQDIPQAQSPQRKPKRKRAQNNSQQTPRIEENDEYDMDKSSMQNSQTKRPIVKKKPTSAQRLQHLSSSQTSDNYSQGTTNQNLLKKSTLVTEESSFQNNMKKVAVKLNPAKELLVKQREFYWDLFQSQLESAIPEKSVVTDMVQIMKMFLSHIEQSVIYWTKFWLVSSQLNKDVVIAYQTNVSEVRKLKIIFTKSIELVSLLLDNYYYYQELSIEYPDDFIKIHEFNFRINKKWLNFYIFSEQEYQEISLESLMVQAGQTLLNQKLLYPLLCFLMRTLNLMHSKRYIHGGIKPSNIYLYYDSKGKLRFKLDVSFDTMNFNRRNMKLKELRQSEIYDLEDIAFLVFSLELKENARSHLKFKMNEFSGIMTRSSHLAAPQIKLFLLLLSRESQIYFDLRTNDLLRLLENLPQNEVTIPLLNKKRKSKPRILWTLRDRILCYYCLTNHRQQKSLTRLKLYSPEWTQINIISISECSEMMYLLYEQNGTQYVGSVPKKLMTDTIEDTIEIFLLIMRQIMTQNDGSKARQDSGSSLQFHITTQSPNSAGTQDQFKFQSTSKKSQTGLQNYDKACFTLGNIKILFGLIDSENKGYIGVNDFLAFLVQENSDDMLSKQLQTGLQAMVDFFAIQGRICLNSFQEIFKYAQKRIKPISRCPVTMIGEVSDIKSIVIYDKLLFLFGQECNTTIVQLPSFEVKKRFLIQEDLEYPQIHFKEDFFLLFGRNAKKQLRLDFYDYNFDLNRSYVSEFHVDQGFTLHQLKHHLCFCIFQDKSCLVIRTDQEVIKIIFEFEVQESNSIKNYISSDNMILSLRNRNDDLYLSRVWLIPDLQFQIQIESSIRQILKDLGKYDSKIRVRTSQRIQQTHLIPQHEPIGKYIVRSLVYPNSGVNIGSLAQFRVLKVYHSSFHEKDQILLQRTVHGEFESFDDCYTVCKYWDSEKRLRDFFLTYEFDSRVRLNYVFDEGEQLSTTKMSDSALWQLMKKCFKELHHLKSNGIIVQELHPENIQLVMVDKQEKVEFFTLTHKLNLPSVYSEKFVPIQGCLEYMEPKMIEGAINKQFCNHLLLNPVKSNVYILGLIFVKIISQQNRKSTNDPELFQIELTQILNSLQCSPQIMSIIEYMLKDNDEQRLDYQQLLAKMKLCEDPWVFKSEFKLNQSEQLPSPTLIFAVNNQQIDIQIHSGFQTKMLTAVYTSNSGVEILGVFKDPTVYVDGNYRNVQILVKSVEDLAAEYKLISFKVDCTLSQDFQGIQQHEILDFNEIADKEDSDPIVQSVHRLEIAIPFYEMLDCSSPQTFLADNTIFVMGGHLNFGSQQKPSLDCYSYNVKRQSCKKLGLIEIQDQVQIVDAGESLYLIDHNQVTIITKAPFAEKTHKIKLKGAKGKKPLEAWKLNSQNVLIVEVVSGFNWVMNLETLRTKRLKDLPGCSVLHRLFTLTDQNHLIYQGPNGLIIRELDQKTKSSNPLDLS